MTSMKQLLFLPAGSVCGKRNFAKSTDKEGFESMIYVSETKRVNMYGLTKLNGKYGRQVDQGRDEEEEEETNDRYTSSKSLS